MGEKRIGNEKRLAVLEAFDFMEKFLEGRKWFCGDNLTLADLSILATISTILVRRKRNSQLQ
jgi:glutathione S-transferase